MVKTAALSVRVAPDLKLALEKQATKEGRALASYIERILILHHMPPVWTLRDPQPFNRKKDGALVALPIAEGWPTAMIAANRAESLGEQLIGVAKLAKKIPPAA